jgi:hypothetical protein
MRLAFEQCLAGFTDIQTRQPRTLVDNLSADFKPEKYDATYRRELLAR